MMRQPFLGVGLGPFEGAVANTQTQNKGLLWEDGELSSRSLGFGDKAAGKKPTLSQAGAVSRAFLEVCV